MALSTKVRFFLPICALLVLVGMAVPVRGEGQPAAPWWAAASTLTEGSRPRQARPVAPEIDPMAATCAYDSSGTGTVTITPGADTATYIERSGSGDVSVYNQAYVSCTDGDVSNPAAAVVVEGAGGGWSDVYIYAPNWTGGTSITVNDADGPGYDDGDYLVLLGGPEDDTIDASSLPFTLTAPAVSYWWIEGGAGDDLLTAGTPGGVTVNGAYAVPEADGGDGNDLIFGTSDDDYLSGDAGNDTIFGGGGEDDVYGGSGNDVLHGGDGDDFISSGAGGEDLLRGEGGDDELRSGGAHVFLDGGDGDDALFAGPGTDWFSGGDGEDRITYQSSPAGVSIDLGTGTHTGYALGDVYFDYEILLGSNYKDTLTGGPGDDWLAGASGDDRLAGAGGDDYLAGGYGRDAADGGPGWDECGAERERYCET